MKLTEKKRSGADPMKLVKRHFAAFEKMDSPLTHPGVVGSIFWLSSNRSAGNSAHQGDW
jgi:hypothetical protein